MVPEVDHEQEEGWLLGTEKQPRIAHEPCVHLCGEELGMDS